MKLINNPKWHHITSQKWNPRLMKFRDKHIHVKENPRIGVCNLCRAVVGTDCEKTSIHHLEYHDDDPLRDTIELCNSCHAKTHLTLSFVHHKSVLD